MNVLPNASKFILPYMLWQQLLKKGWSGLKNGQLMTAASADGFDILLPIDKNLQHQQNVGKYPLIVAVLNSPSSKLEVLITFLSAFEQQLPAFIKGNACLVSLK